MPLRVFPERSELRRIGLETALAFSCAVFAAHTQGSSITGEPQPQRSTVTVTTAEGDHLYQLPARYDGLIAEESWGGGTLRLVAYEGQRNAAYEFDFGLGLAFSGDTMYEVEGKGIPAPLRADFLTARTAFCQQATARNIQTERTKRACSNLERIPGA